MGTNGVRGGRFGGYKSVGRFGELVYRMELTYDKNVDILDMKKIAGSTNGYTLPPVIFEVTDLGFMLNALIANEVKVIFTKNDIRLRSNLTTKKTMKFIRKSFFYTTFCFNQLYSVFFERSSSRILSKYPGSYKSEKPINITGIDEIHLKYNCNNAILVKGVIEQILLSATSDKPPGYEMYKVPGIKLFKKWKKPVLSRLNFYSEDNDHKLVVLNAEIIPFTCRLNRI